MGLLFFLPRCFIAMSRKFSSYSSLIILSFVLLIGKGISQTEQDMTYIQDSISMSSCLDSIEKYINFNNKPKAYEFTLKGLYNTPRISDHYLRQKNNH